MNAIRQSFDRARQAEFAERFYRRFLSADPAIRLRFRHTDFERQRELLTHAVYSMLDYAEGKALGKMALDRLAHMHSDRELDIPPHMYDVWLRCFFETLREVDPHLDQALAEAWNAALAPGIRLLSAAHHTDRAHPHRAKAPTSK